MSKENMKEAHLSYKIFQNWANPQIYRKFVRWTHVTKTKEVESVSDLVFI